MMYKKRGGEYLVTTLFQLQIRLQPSTILEKPMMNRNARQVTDFVNDELHKKMLLVGLNGILKKVHIIPNLKMESDDRVAIIVKDISEKIRPYEAVVYLTK